MVPLLAAAVLTYGLFVDPATAAGHVRALAEALPPSAAGLIGEQLQSIVAGSSSAKGFGLALSLAVALFGARNGAGSVISGLDIAYGVKDERNFLMLTALALGVTVGAIIALACVGIAIGAASTVDGSVGTLAGLALVAVSGAGGAAVLYRVLPDRARPAWREVLPGAALFGVALVLLTLGFSTYVTNFASYNATYGSLGAVIILLTWLYLSAYALLFGAILNAVSADH